MRIWSIILAGAGIALGMTAPAAAAGTPAATGAPPRMPYDDEVTARNAPPSPNIDEGHAHDRPGVAYDAPPYPHIPHHPHEPVVTTTQAPGYVADGYYYPGAITTTVVVQPAMTTTRSYVTETATYRKVVVRRKMRGK